MKAAQQIAKPKTLHPLVRQERSLIYGTICLIVLLVSLIIMEQTRFENRALTSEKVVHCC